jgi:hypothetical protein
MSSVDTILNSTPLESQMSVRQNICKTVPFHLGPYIHFLRYSTLVPSA